MKNPKPKALVIGAGLGGLAAASRLQQAGCDVLVLDKAKGVGGRAATKRFGDLRVDTGAQFFTAKDSEFQSLVTSELAKGEIFEWSRGFPIWENGKIFERPDGHARYACRSGMSALAKLFAKELSVQTACLAKEIRPQSSSQNRYQIQLEGGSKIETDTLILNLPPEQLLPLAGHLLSDELKQRLESLKLSPCFAFYGKLSRDLPVSWKGLELRGHPLFQWVARDHTRRTPGSPPVLVAHTHADWTESRLEHDPARLKDDATAELSSLLGISFDTPMEIHRWRYSQLIRMEESPMPDALLWDSERRIGVCGDWTQGGRVEGAILSGWRLASRMGRLSH